MSWNYRVVRMRDPDGTESLHVCEVYYDKDGAPRSYTEHAAGAMGESLTEICESLDRMIACLDKPILDERDFKKMGRVNEGHWEK